MLTEILLIIIAILVLIYFFIGKRWEFYDFSIPNIKFILRRNVTSEELG